MRETVQAFVPSVHQSSASFRLPLRVGEGITPQVFLGRWLLYTEDNSLAKQAGMSHWQPKVTQMGEGNTCPGEGVGTGHNVIYHTDVRTLK